MAARAATGWKERAFLWINDLAIASRDAGNGRKVGRRLYLYLSGHGFSPEARQGCLLAGNASPERVTANIGASLWLQWWQDAGYFREYVLLMDCCMNRTQIAAPTPAPLAAINVNDPPVANFIAFAAKRPLRAVEAPIAEDKGRYHGLFTAALLEGLRGAAVDSLGMVTGHSPRQLAAQCRLSAARRDRATRPGRFQGTRRSSPRTERWSSHRSRAARLQVDAPPSGRWRRARRGLSGRARLPSPMVLSGRPRRSCR